MKRIAIFPGSFNPFTIGHASIVERALPLFDEIVLMIGVNADKPADEAASRRAAIERIYAGEMKVRVEHTHQLTVEAARRVGACCILRGVRSVKDFEYERDMADVNRRLTGIETMLLFALPEHACISSSVVRELESYGCDVSTFLPSPSKHK